MKTQLGHHLYI